MTTTATTPDIRGASASGLISLLAAMTKDRECTFCRQDGDTPNPECTEHQPWDMESDDAVETLHNLIDSARGLMQPPSQGEPSRESCIQAAKENYQNDDVEIDDDALLSRAPDAYASWVQAWVYVRYADCAEGGATLMCAKCQKSGLVPWADFERNPQAHGWNPVGDDGWLCDDCDASENGSPTGYTRLELTFIVTILMLTALTVGLMYASENSVISQEIDEPVRLVQLVEGPGGGLYYSGCQTDVECEDEWRELLRARGVVHDIRAHAGHFDATLTLTAGARDLKLSEFESAAAIEEWANEHNYTVGGQ